MTPRQIRTLAGWYCALNNWEWPDDFPWPKPEGFDDLSWSDKRKIPIYNVAYRTLCTIVPAKERLRYIHTSPNYGINRTDAEFEEWWVHKGAMFIL